MIEAVKRLLGARKAPATTYPTTGENAIVAPVEIEAINPVGLGIIQHSVSTEYRLVSGK